MLMSLMRWSLSLALAMFCAGCSGTPMPKGPVWGFVVKDDLVMEEQYHQDRFMEDVAEHFRSQLPVTVRQFEDILEAEGFQCFPHHRGQNLADDDVRCVYFERGPISRGACAIGMAVAISITFDETEPVKGFDLASISRADKDSGAYGMCFML
jgi:hypothetical protein